MALNRSPEYMGVCSENTVCGYPRLLDRKNRSRMRCRGGGEGVESSISCVDRRTPWLPTGLT